MPAKTHGDSKSAEHRIWRLMRSRCTNPNDPAFANYGGRGIAVCDRWHSYQNFLADVGRRPSEGHTLDRIDNEKGYSPENCRWATRAEQLRNKRNTLYAEFRGKRMRIRDIAALLGKHPNTIAYRAAHGKPLDGDDYVRN